VPDRALIIQHLVNRIRLVLEIEPIEDSMTGRLSTSDGDSLEFAGWLGLLNTLETVIGEPPSRSDEPQQIS
jgi:hypothetical protein